MVCCLHVWSVVYTQVVCGQHVWSVVSVHGLWSTRVVCGLHIMWSVVYTCGLWSICVVCVWSTRVVCGLHVWSVVYMRGLWSTRVLIASPPPPPRHPTRHVTKRRRVEPSQTEHPTAPLLLRHAARYEVATSAHFSEIITKGIDVKTSPADYTDQ